MNELDGPSDYEELCEQALIALDDIYLLTRTIIPEVDRSSQVAEARDLLEQLKVVEHDERALLQRLKEIVSALLSDFENSAMADPGWYQPMHELNDRLDDLFNLTP